MIITNRLNVPHHCPRVRCSHSSCSCCRKMSIYLRTSSSDPRFSFLSHNEQSKNTCAHNNTHKAHANGIKKKKRTKYVSTKGMDPKFLRNQKFCKKYNGTKRVHTDE
mmetsp:Transcript_41108/g.72326  ORF Transcript_41108/g.72326 Transcript_41108/m.72326 type:complete len:107 (+) Transcript_41108:127-447(+)